MIILEDFIWGGGASNGPPCLWIMSQPQFVIILNCVNADETAESVYLVISPNAALLGPPEPNITKIKSVAVFSRYLLYIFVWALFPIFWGGGGDPLPLNIAAPGSNWLYDIFYLQHIQLSYIWSIEFFVKSNVSLFLRLFRELQRAGQSDIEF